ncbi:hypothetical protein, partial [Acetobacter indonesiensis]
QFQIKQIAHAVVTDLHTAPIPRSGFALPPIVDINAKEINSQISLAVFITNQWFFLGQIEYYPN